MEVIILDGCSLSGKTTLRNILYKEYSSSLLVIDRFTPSNWVYDYLRGNNRKREIIKFEGIFDLIFRPILFILFTSSESSIKREIKRRNSTKEIHNDKIFDIHNELLAFDKYYNEICQYKDKSRIDTSNISVDECLSLIKGVIDGRGI